MDISLTGKSAVVTGAASGIGRGIAQMLAKNGAEVFAVDLNRAGGAETVQLVRNDGGKATFLEGDVSSEASMLRVAEEVGKATGGVLNLLVNNAGVELFKGLEDTTSAEWDKVIGVDLKGIFNGTKSLLPLLKKAGAAGHASVVNIASVHAHATLASITAYAAAKGGVVALTRSLAQDLGPMGINVNSISPGFIDTPMVRRYFATQDDPAAALARVVKLHSVGRIGKPEDIAHMIAFLASGHARFVAGVNLTIDGGLTAKLQH